MTHPLKAILFERSSITTSDRKARQDCHAFPPEPNVTFISACQIGLPQFRLAAQYKGTCTAHGRYRPAGEKWNFRVDPNDCCQGGWDSNWDDRHVLCVGLLREALQFAIDLSRRQGVCLQLKRGADTAIPGNMTERERIALTRPGTIDENLDLFSRMRAGEFWTAKHVLRAKIDMAPRTSHCATPSSTG